MNLLGLSFVLLFAGLIWIFTFLGRRGARQTPLRPIEALLHLPATIGQAVESGRRLHISLGNGSIGQADTAATLAGLTVLDQVAAVASVSDKPPIVTTGDGVAMLLAQDTLRHVYTQQQALDRYDPASVRLAGASALSFGAASADLLKNEAVAGTLLVGSVGPEAILLTEASTRANLTTLAGSDDPATQALLFAAADQPLIGEDLFASGAYIGRHPGHQASLRAQDSLRLVIVAVILIGALAKTLGLLP